MDVKRKQPPTHFEPLSGTCYLQEGDKVRIHKGMNAFEGNLYGELIDPPQGMRSLGSMSKPSKYHREIKPGVFVDVYDVLHAWRVINPALQHLIKKALQPGERGHKDLEQDLKDIEVSAKRARELGHGPTGQ